MKKKILSLMCFSLVLMMSGSSWGQLQGDAFFVLLDTSTSMREKPLGWTQSKIDAVKKNVTEFCKALPLGSEVSLFTFDQGIRTQLENVTIAADSDHAKPLTFVDGIKALGEATYAWSSLDMLLAKAREATAKHPNRGVHVLLYTDGEDTQRGGLSLADVLSKYQSELKLGSIHGVYVTVGFEPRGGIKDTFTGANFEVKSGFDPSGLVILQANFSWAPQKPTVSSEVTFVDRTAGLVDAWTWDFGDGATLKDKSPTHRYAKAGEFPVKLTVRHPGGKENSVSKTVSIAPDEKPEPHGSLNPNKIRSGETVQFMDESKGAVAKYAWDFGDGGKSDQRHPRHGYDKPGRYAASLTITDEKGQTYPAQIGTVEVEPPLPPKPEIYAPVNARVGAPCQFLDRSNGLVTTRQWNFGDGSAPSSERDPAHVFAKAGKYEVVMRCEGPGGVAQVSRTVTVEQIPPPKAKIVVGIDKLRPGEAVKISDVSTGEVDRAVWSFGDGSADVSADYGKEAERFLAHTFAKAGSFTIRLTVSGPGGEASASETVTVTAPPPVEPPKAKFIVGVDRPRSGDSVKFSDISSGTVNQAVWDFGDGAPAVTVDYSKTPKEAIPHTYSKEGDYVVRLTVAGPGGKDEKIQTVTVVKALLPKPAFHHIPKDDIIQAQWDGARKEASAEVVYINDTASMAGVRHLWTFGAGGPATEQKDFPQIKHLFAPGDYEVALRLELEGKSIGSYSQRISIKDVSFFTRYWIESLGGVIGGPILLLILLQLIWGTLACGLRGQIDYSLSQNGKVVDNNTFFLPPKKRNATVTPGIEFLAALAEDDAQPKEGRKPLMVEFMSPRPWLFAKSQTMIRFTGEPEIELSDASGNAAPLTKEQWHALRSGHKMSFATGSTQVELTYY